MARDLPGLDLHVPPEGCQTCLAVVLALAFCLGVGSVGAVYRLLLVRIVADLARAHQMPGQAASDHQRAVIEATAPSLIMLLLRSAFARGPRV